jgi:RHS repeat-associated protein
VNPSRTFTYDSLGRLRSAANAESGTTSYGYDNNSNLTSRTDGRVTTTTLTYDALNRLTDKTYSDNPGCQNPANSTPCVHYTYSGYGDFVASVTSINSSYTYSNYDALGRPGAGTQVTGGQTFTFPSVVWTPQGQISSITYPSGRVVTTAFDGAGRISTVSGLMNGSPRTYVNGAAYASHGGVSSLPLGDNVTRVLGYNARLQMNSLSAGSNLSLGFGFYGNGNVQSQTITRPGLSVTQTFGYDGANRLSSASEANWNQTYVYDNVGNRAVLPGTVLSSNDTPQTGSTTYVGFGANNHWGLANYDGAGNATLWNTTSSIYKTLNYDAEGRGTLWQAWSNSTVTSSVSLTYDGDGRRVTKTANGTVTTYVYDPAGNLAAEYGGATPAVTGTVYLTRDHLGSTRLVTTASGCVGAYDYLPFGEEIPSSYGRGSVPCYGQTDATMKFGGYERDAETGLDNSLARHMAGPQGRFTAVDPDNAGADPGYPQTWNAYAYVGNSPLVNTDPDGLFCPATGCDDDSGDEAAAAEAAAQAIWDLWRLSQQQTWNWVTQTAQQFVTVLGTFRNSPSCAAALTAGGAAVGTAMGGAAGADIGGTAGAGAGTLVFPGGGTVAGGIGGAAIGGAAGAYVGNRGGAAIGTAAANIFCSSSSASQGSGSASGGGRSGVAPDIEKKVKQFEKKPLSDQKSIYNNLKKTYLEHLAKYGQTAGQTTGETNRMERELNEMRRILASRGQQVD